MKRRWLACALTLAVAAACRATDLPEQWRSWRYSRTLQPAVAGLAKLSVPLDLYPRLGDGFAELRVVDDLGHEVPYLIHDQNVRAPIETRSAILRENSYVPGKYTQLVIDLGERPAFHNALEIGTSQTDFINWVEIAASDDARTWRTVKDRAPISRFRNEDIAGSQLVRYSENNAQFLRVRILETARQFPVSSASVRFSREFQQPPVRTAVPLALRLDSGAPSETTRWTADLGSASFPVSGVEIATTQSEFYRVVHMRTSEDGNEWQHYFSGPVYRYRQGDKQAESLRVYSHEGWHHRFWQIEIVNGNNAPLADAKPSLLTIPYFVLFYAQPERSYRLLYGNAVAKLPVYDLSRTLDYGAVPGAASATMGGEELTSDYRDPRPYSERHPTLLWIALIAAVALLAYTAFRALREPARTTP